MDTANWLDSLTGDSTAEIALRSGIPERTLYQQRKKRQVSAENVIRIAVAYGMHPLHALIRAGYVADVWSQIDDVDGALRAASDDQLTDEILRRLKLGSQSFDEPVDVAAERRRRERAEAATPAIRGVVDDGLPAVADSSPDEPEEGTDFD